MNDVLRTMLLEMLQGYVKLSMFAVQKQMLTQRRPNQWQIDTAFSGMFQNVPMYAAQCQQPMMDINKPAIDPNQVQAMVNSLAGSAPQPQAPVVGAQATWDGTQWVVAP